MNPTLGISLALLLIVCGCGGERFDTIRNVGSAGETIICFGDSLTEGVGAEPGEEYPTILSRLLGMRVLNAGHRGDTTARALQRVRTSVVAKNPRLVILLLGGNDFLRQVPTRETRENLKEIVRQIQAHGAMVALAGIKLGFFTDEYGPIFEETAAEFGAIYIPQVMKGIFNDTKLKSDQIHPNSAGYRLIAERIAQKIKPLLNEADRLRGRL
ncbi:MAG TPA: GDSL-type esterase/lipase family protein [Candidatus Binatia bacterium]|nr:GDSL-type esterase/lipase family protein [Candidatus Binatia bacterium]